MATNRTRSELDAAIDHLRTSPKDSGRLELIVRRPAENQREVLEEGTLDLDEGLVGDTWRLRPSDRSTGGGAHPDMQLNLMNARVTELIAVDRARWPLAGDQLYVDLDLSGDNLPPGTQLAVGTAVIEVTDQPHRGCAKFKQRFGQDALRFVNSDVGRELNLRGINAKVIQPGIIRQGDTISRLDAGARV